MRVQRLRRRVESRGILFYFFLRHAPATDKSEMRDTVWSLVPEEYQKKKKKKNKERKRAIGEEWTCKIHGHLESSR